MSPFPWNIYQNDLHEIFNGDWDLVKMESAHINSISRGTRTNVIFNIEVKITAMLGKFYNVLPEMVSIHQYRKDRNNGIVKEKYISEIFTFWDIPWQKFKSIDHLGFVISYNEKYRSITHHRIMKSIKMANIVLQRMWTNMNVSARLALPLFDKQITTIVLYGCPVWSLPDSQPACMNIKKNLYLKVLLTSLAFTYARRVGRNIPKYKQMHSYST